MSTNPSKVPPFRRIANELRAEILRGDLSPGDKIPSQEQLEQRFGASRATVRKGVAVLATEGLVTTSQGKASIVRERPSVSLRQTGSIYRARRATGEANFNAEARAQGQRVHQEIREVVEAPAPEVIAERFRLAPGAPVVVRRLLFVAESKDGGADTPLQLCDGYYDAAVARETRLAEARLIKGGANALIEDPDGPIGRRITQFIEDLDIRMPYPHEIEQLNIPVGVPVARVIRTAYDSAGDVLEVLDSIVPCDRHVFRYVIDV
ncbi:GntR family transcriptional regulator [Streptomyces acidicola]|uniref:GntR family transcriptional regulator n=1 Tax=Streptomyces acidicola TaxID=2596892 RepID=A0A5N8WI30_9ACTN|nr:GntR family transcriptional regulator [Streptomyces acidicola]MPY47113.1 GntR family transcriptional regulator [Streptomyces acidicola]MPY47252.1 GntR family transcriptional regulator [Streptomyces acidicola]